MTSEERKALIGQYGDGYAEVVRSLAGIAKEQLTAHPLPGKWSAAEIVHHLADSEMTSAIRLRLLLTQSNPVINGYDQDEFAKRLEYNEREIGPSLEAFRYARLTTMQILSRMTDADWDRQGWHTESGLYSTEKWLRIYADHAYGHAAQIRRLAEALSN